MIDRHDKRAAGTEDLVQTRQHVLAVDKEQSKTARDHIEAVGGEGQCVSVHLLYVHIVQSLALGFGMGVDNHLQRQIHTDSATAGAEIRRNREEDRSTTRADIEDPHIRGKIEPSHEFAAKPAESTGSYLIVVVGGTVVSTDNILFELQILRRSQVQIAFSRQGSIVRRTSRPRIAHPSGVTRGSELKPRTEREGADFEVLPGEVGVVPEVERSTVIGDRGDADTNVGK